MSARLFWRYPSDAAAISATSAAAGYPASNVQLPHANEAEAWRSGGTLSVERLTFDLGTVYWVSAFAAICHNFTSDYSGIKIQANSADSWTTPAFEHSVTWREGKLVEFFAPQAYRYWSLKFTKPDAATVASIARVVLGEHYEFEQNVSARSVEFKSDEDTQTSRTPGGASHSDVAAHLDGQRFKIEWIPQAQKDELDAMNRAVGLHTPIIVSLDHELMPVTGLIYGKQARKVSFRDRSWISQARYDAELELVEEK